MRVRGLSRCGKLHRLKWPKEAVLVQETEAGGGPKEAGDEAGIVGLWQRLPAGPARPLLL
jgi:hypothetical protein